jgi:hypothetical protein
MRLLSLTCAALLLWPRAAGAAGTNASLVQAEQLLEDLDYEGAAVALLSASKALGNDRQTVLRILELQGVIAASLDQKDSAVAFFRTLLSLDPGYTLSEARYSAEQRAPFLEARGQLQLQGVPPLRFEAASARVRPGLVETVGVKVPSDPAGLARKVRFFIRVEGAPQKEVMVALEGGKVSMPVNAAAVSWWAELLGEYESRLSQVGSAEKPLSVKAPTHLEPLVGSVDLLGGARPYAIAAGGAGVVAGLLGGYFGLQSQARLRQIEGWKAEAAQGDGVVRSTTQVEAYRLQEEAVSHAITANVLFGTAAALAGAGAALWFLEPGRGAGHGGAAVRISASAGGVQVAVPWP